MREQNRSRELYTETTTTTTSTTTASFWYARDFSARLATSRSQAAPVGPGKIETALARTKSIQRALHGDYYFFFCDYGFVLVCVRVIRTDFSARLATYGRSMREREISPRKRALSLSRARARVLALQAAPLARPARVIGFSINHGHDCSRLII